MPFARWLFPHKLPLGTQEWFVVHHTAIAECSCFTGEIIGNLLEDNLETAQFDGKDLVESEARRRLRRRSLHPLAHLR